MNSETGGNVSENPSTVGGGAVNDKEILQLFREVFPDSKLLDPNEYEREQERYSFKVISSPVRRIMKEITRYGKT
jgi:hypothetical protein